MIEYKGYILRQTGNNNAIGHYYSDLWSIRIGKHELVGTIEYLKQYIDGLGDQCDHYTQPI